MAKGMNIVELAAAADMDRTVLGKMEKDGVFVEPEVYRRLTRALSTTLSAVDLVNAIGYTVDATSQAKLPPGLVDLLAVLEPDDFAVIERIARGLRLAPATQSRRARRPTTSRRPVAPPVPTEDLRPEGQP